jgi:hypothetical protein
MTYETLTFVFFIKVFALPSKTLYKSNLNIKNYEQDANLKKVNYPISIIG